jgi:hypothetical protein
MVFSEHSTQVKCCYQKSHRIIPGDSQPGGHLILNANVFNFSLDNRDVIELDNLKSCRAQQVKDGGPGERLEAHIPSKMSCYLDCISSVRRGLSEVLLVRSNLQLLAWWEVSAWGILNVVN